MNFHLLTLCNPVLNLDIVTMVTCASVHSIVCSLSECYDKTLNIMTHDFKKALIGQSLYNF